jgi:two-component system chemotaxis response regulator CheY
MSKRILVVDDSSMMRKMIEKILTQSGHTIVGEAKNGAEAVEMYRSLKPDLVTMDITMREMDGFTAAKEILRLDDTAQIIFLSNLDEDKFGADAQQLGAVGYVNKRKSIEILDLIDNH